MYDGIGRYLGTGPAGLTAARAYMEPLIIEGPEPVGQLTLTKEVEELIETDGIFIAIGHNPNTEFLKGKLDMDENGYFLVEPGTTNTKIPGIFACGDVQDQKYRQAITAAGTGCMAAMDTERFIEGESTLDWSQSL